MGFTTTTNLGLKKPDKGEVDWDDEVNKDFDDIDALFVPRDKILWVATDGNDTTGNGTLSKPYLTIAKAVTEADAGDTILLFPGTYDQGSTKLSLSKVVKLLGVGTERSAVLITGAPAADTPTVEITTSVRIENVTIQATGSNSGAVPVEVKSSAAPVLRHVYLDNNAVGSGCHALKITSAMPVLVDCDLTCASPTDSNGVYGAGATAATFRETRINSASGLGAYFHDADCDSVLFDRCYIRTGEGAADYGIVFNAAVTGVKVRYSVLDCGAATESIHVGAATTMAVYLCALSAALDGDITNSIAAPQNVEDADI